MKQETKLKIRYFTYSILVTAILVGGALWYAHEPQLGVTNELKADKSDVLFHETIIKTKIKKETVTSSEEIIDESYVKYFYKSEKKVKTYQLQGLDEDVSRRTSNTKVFPRPNGGNVYEVIVGYPQYKEDKGEWYHIENTTTTLEIFEQAMVLSWLEKLIGYEAYATDFPTGAGDGSEGQTNASWDVAHDASVGSVDYGDSTGAQHWSPRVSNTHGGGSDPTINRLFIPNNTSAIGAGETISAATFSIYVDSKGNDDNDGDDWINIVETTQADETILALTDYNEVGATNTPTEIATRIDITNITTSAYNVWTLTDLTAVKKSGEASTCGSSLTGWSCLGMREGHDAIDSAVVGVESISGILIRSSEYAGTDTDPKLTITTGAADTCTPTIDEVWKMDLQDHCTTTDSFYSKSGMECYNQSGGSWVIAGGTEVRVASSTNCIPQIEGTGVFSIQPSQ